jgi:hypothetical protein
MEPAWMKKIQSSTICNFFFIFYIVYLVIFVLSVISLIGTVVYMKKMGPAGLSLAIQAVLMTGLATTATLFYYLICDRALLSGAVKEVQEKFMNQPSMPSRKMY